MIKRCIIYDLMIFFLNMGLGWDVLNKIGLGWLTKKKKRGLKGKMDYHFFFNDINVAG